MAIWRVFRSYEFRKAKFNKMTPVLNSVPKIYHMQRVLKILGNQFFVITETFFGHFMI